MSLTAVIESCALSDTGPVREDNQDCIHASGEQHPAGQGFLFAVADGMGGYAHGGMASSLALQTLTNELYNAPAPGPKILRRAIENANLRIYKAAQHNGAGRMGTTLTAAYVLGEQAHLAHIGDSRAYLLRGGKVTCLTSDHTTVGDLVRARLISADRVRTHAQRSILTRAVGLGMFVQPDLDSFKLHEGDRIILCSDGLWSMVQDDEFGSPRHETGVEAAARRLIDLALERETDDNVSVVVFDVKKFTRALPQTGAGKPGLLENLMRKWAR